MGAGVVSMRMKRIFSAQMVESTEEQFQAIAIRRLVSKLDGRLIPFLVLLQISSSINLTTIDHVEIWDMQANPSMSRLAMDWTLSIFFLAYLIFGIPSHLLLRFIGPRRYLSLDAIIWGSLAVGMAFVSNVRGLIIIRFFLGMAVSGLFPSIVIYFSLWYRKRDQTMRIAILYAASIFGCGLGCLSMQGIAIIDGMGGLGGMQWILLLEGLSIIAVGTLTYLFLGTLPDTVQWLTNCEKQILTNLLREDAGVADSEFTSCVRLSWRQVRYTFTDWRVYFYAVIGVCDFGVIIFLDMFIPSLVQSMSYSRAKAHWIAAPLYGVICIFCLLAGFSSSRRKEHGFHLIFCLSVALLGFILMLTLSGHGSMPLFLSTCVAYCGSFAAYPLILSWITTNIGGQTKRTMAVGFAVCMGQIPGIVVPQIYHVLDEPVYQAEPLICIGFLIVGLLATCILRFTLMLENRRRDRLSTEQHDREAAVKEPCDWHPDIRYIL